MLDEAQVWFVRTARVADAEVAAAQELLSTDEVRRQQRLRTETLRRDFAIKRALVRLVLSRHVAVDPRAWTFGTIDNGRPCIASPAAGDLDISISDTNGLVAVLTTRGVRSAIDVEHLERSIAVDGIAARFFSAEERDAYFMLDESRRRRRFFELWTAKEAYVKTLGAGLAEGFRGFTIQVDPLRVGDGWYLEPINLGESYAATVAVRGEARRIAIHETGASFFGGEGWI